MAWHDPAGWYDVLNPWGPNDDFYLELVMAAQSVLDVGCGTGMLLRRARDAGHTGRPCGLDPDPAMLRQAMACTEVEWVLADAASAPWEGEFELAVMTGHAFQQLASDDQRRRSLTAIRRSLGDHGRFVFETRHPQARAWEGWNASFETRNPEGEVVRVTYRLHDVAGDVTGVVVRVSETFSGRWWERGHTDDGVLRFLSPQTLSRFLDEAGFTVADQFGDWERRPLGHTSDEIITIARCRRPEIAGGHHGS